MSVLRTIAAVHAALAADADSASVTGKDALADALRALLHEPDVTNATAAPIAAAVTTRFLEWPLHLEEVIEVMEDAPGRGRDFVALVAGADAGRDSLLSACVAPTVSAGVFERVLDLAPLAARGEAPSRAFVSALVNAPAHAPPHARTLCERLLFLEYLGATEETRRVAMWKRLALERRAAAP